MTDIEKKDQEAQAESMRAEKAQKSAAQEHQKEAEKIHEGHSKV